MTSMSGISEQAMPAIQTSRGEFAGLNADPIPNAATACEMPDAIGDVLGGRVFLMRYGWTALSCYFNVNAFRTARWLAINS